MFRCSSSKAKYPVTSCKYLFSLKDSSSYNPEPRPARPSNARVWAYEPYLPTDWGRRMPWGMTDEICQRVFPFTPLSHLQANLPDILQVATASGADRVMFLMALATIRAETESFVPCAEQVSRFNTSSGGTSFDLYDRRADLGNQGPPDGERYRGRGYVQLTGRFNYNRFGPPISLDLITSPELAAGSYPAARLLFCFLNAKGEQLHKAAAEGNLAQARRLVNGGFHGLDRFCDAYRIADSLLENA